MNQETTRDRVPHILNWQIAYAARELRHNKTVTISCLKGETNLVLEQLNSFSSLNPIRAKTTEKPNSKEVYLEVFETI